MQIFDIHAHIYPDAIAKRAAQAISEGYGNIKVHNDGTLKTLLEKSEAAGVTKLAVHSVATAPGQVEKINGFVMDTARKYPDKLVPFGALHPDTPFPEQAVDRLVADGFMGIKLHPELQNFRVDESRAIDMFSAIAGKLPVLMHCGDYRSDHSAPERIRKMIREVPKLKLVCAHLGGWTRWEEAASMLIGENVWVDTSSSLYALDRHTATAILRGYGTDRVLFGTDYPVWNPDEEVKRLLELPLTDEEKARILWTNHLELLKR